MSTTPEPLFHRGRTKWNKALQESMRKMAVPYWLRYRLHTFGSFMAVQPACCETSIIIDSLRKRTCCLCMTRD